MLVVGPSGSGKTTLARGIAGLLPSHYPGTWDGSLVVGDRELAVAAEPPAAVADDRDDPDHPAVGRPLPSAGDPRVGIVFQDPASQLVMERVGDDVAFGLESRAWPRPDMVTRVPAALEQVGLAGFAERRSARLSGGEQQRVAIAGVIAPFPGVLVLDEPTANLDADGTEAVFRTIAAIRTARSATVVLVEHHATLAWPLADLVVALGGDGRAIDIGPPDVVLRRSRVALEAAGIWLPEDDSARSRRSRSRAAVAPAAAPAAARGSAPPSAEVPILALRDVRFGFEPGAPVVRDINLTIRAGERVALTGPNGSGKTTLLRLALGLLAPTAGVVLLGERDPRRARRADLARLAGYVVQDPELGFVADTVADEVAAGLDEGLAARARELATRLGLSLETFGERSPYQLSGGEQRRLSLVTGLARRPLLLALDEPTFGQDRRGYEALVAALEELVDAGTALLIATHDERFVRDVADRRVELAEGWLLSDQRLRAAP